MSTSRTGVPIPAVLAGMFMLGCGACSNCASKEPLAGIDAGLGQGSGTAQAVDQAEPREIPRLIRTLPRNPHPPEDLTAVATELDEQNRFPSAVIVSSFPPSTPMGSLCTGVLVADRLVLTAGNCVCSGRKQPAPGGGQQTLIDSTSCATSAEVRTILYEPPPPDGAVLALSKREYRGEVRPHPSLKIVLDEQGNIVSSEADLAVIEVTRSPADHIPPLALVDGDLRVNEPLVMLGYDAWTGEGERRFRQYHVTQILDAGARALFDQPRRDVYKGDSGGPCIRVTDRDMALAGILNRSLGAEASFTSTFHYRDWIRQEIQRAADGSHSPH